MNCTIRDLGTLGGSWSGAYALNDAGQVVGASADGGGATRAFRWSGGTMADIADGWAIDINTKGDVLGISSGYCAYKWSSGSGVSRPEVAHRSAACLNGSEVVAGWVGNASFYNDGTEPGLTDLGVGYAYAEAINASSQIPGFAAISSRMVFRPFLHTAANGMVDLNSYAPPGWTLGVASDVNDSGSIVGAAFVCNGQVRPWLYADGVFTDLGSLGGSHGWARAINKAGTVVGYSRTADNAPHAFIWTPNGGMQDLNDLIPGGSGWVLGIAEDINNHGQICGWGVYSGQTRAFLLTPA